MRTFLLLMLMTGSQFTFAQTDTTTAPSDLKAQYLLKSKNKKSVALTFLIGGGVLVGAGTIGALSDNDLTQWGSDKSGAWIGICWLVGGASMLVSIPFFISSGKYKRMAGELSSIYFLEKMDIPRFASNMPSHYPSIGIRIPIR